MPSVTDLRPEPTSADLTTQALAIAHRALAHGTALGVEVSVAVVDAHGHDLAVLRGPGAPWFTPGVARAKAATAAAMGCPTGALTDLEATYPALAHLIDAQMAQPFTSLPGGVPWRSAGRTIGAVGVSGAHPDQDVACAVAALGDTSA